MAPALTAEPLSTKEKLTSAASPSVVVKKPATPTPATATTRVTRSSKEAAAAASAATKAAAAVVPQRVPSSRISNNKRKLSGGNNSSNKQQNNDTMGLSTAPTPHTTTTTTTTTTSTGSVFAEAEAEAEAATGASVPPISDADVASTSATVLLESESPAPQESESPAPQESESPAPQESDSPPSTDVPPATATIEHNNNNSSGSRASKDNSTAQLLAHLNSDFVETISAEICLRKTLPEVSLSKEPAPSAVALTGAETAVEVAETVAEVEVETEAVTGESTTDVPEPETQIDLIQSMELEQPATTTASVEELPKIDTDNIEERLSQLDGNASTILVELPSVQLDHEQGQVQVEVVIPATPTTPSRQQVQQDPRSEQLPGILASPLPGQRHSTAASALNASQLTPQSTSSSTNFLKDATAGVVLEDPDIEEVLKALKTFEGNHVINPDMCDFNFFSEVWEEPPQATAVTQRSFTPQYTQNPIGGHSGIITSHVPTADSMAECQKSMEHQQQMLTRKMEHLFRRMRKIQARQMCSHTSDEVAGIMEWAARTSHKTPNPVRSDTLSEQETTVQSIVSGRPRPDFWVHQTKHPVPANQMASILRSIATAARHQQICHTPSGGSATLAPSSTWYNSASCAAAVPAKARRGKNQLETSAGAASTSMAAAAVIEQKTPGLHEIIPCFDTHVTNELTHVSGLLHNEMREIQNAIDSDATESSSGGESADEMVTYNNNEQKSLTIARRAVWTYSKDRANIALRWSWLCSQMADLEGRKRQYREMYIDLTQAKGAVELEPMQVQQPANGYKEEPSSEWQCSRARPLMLSKFRKRSLFQTTGIHTISKKAARPSNIKCGCQWPQIPCALCTGRPDPTAPRELAEMMMPANRVALLDPGYHPVLSFDTDVTQSVHFEAVSRQGDWQQRVSRCQAKTVVKGVHRAEREAIAASNSAARRPGDLIKRRYIRRKERNNNNNNNNNSNSNKDATTTAAAATGLGDSGNGTATSTSSTPSTTPLVANSKLFEQEAADAATDWNERFEHIVARLSPTPTTAPPQSLLSSNSTSDLEQRR
ncbi:platelet binding protein GspB isoform X5 [Drosophila guanche]|uniref:platelet binding protein GspB isoform X5 n=1 Tax=Drosophila guanche TaxID=7266 RepID=UPI0014715FC7|nr:platelet binding protein GspB isoform X5 [Drosophila guanche]